MKVFFISPRAALLLATGFLCAMPAGLWAQGDSSASDKSSTSQESVSGANPIRSHDSHNVSGSRTVDTHSLERLGPDGRYQPYLDTETESVKVDANTTRTVVRTYGRDPDGRKKLVQVTEEDAHSLPGGDARVSRTTSNPDVNGGLRVVRREQEETRKTGPESQETSTTILAPDANGRFVPAMQVKQEQTKTGANVTEVRKTTLLPDANGRFQVSEVREGRVEANGPSLTKTENVSRADSEGRLSVVKRTISKDMQGAGGEKQQVVDSYSSQVPGKADNDGLQLNQRVTTTTRSANGGANTSQTVEQRDPSGSGNGMQVTQQTIDIVRPGLSGGSQEHQQSSVRDVNGNTNVVWIDNGKSSTSSPAPAPAQTAPGGKATSSKSKAGGQSKPQ